ncbi:hypothetical protein DPM13_09405 [Paracoccus mutanolyticus]|uniref:CobW/HypB/UreG nucleotide-binding domain-containing protein n=1 Tax=Paracoccus mutanolyticus TaxID=1499308 RepID=A0ABN5M604_9RHOB|nr:hypothetical protein DPM13_09405 [Paracoccus mutanolyticus]
MRAGQGAASRQRPAAHPGLSRTAVIINEFGEIGLDHELVISTTETMVLLQSGCMCCALRGDLEKRRKSRPLCPAGGGVFSLTPGHSAPWCWCASAPARPRAPCSSRWRTKPASPIWWSGPRSSRPSRRRCSTTAQRGTRQIQLAGDLVPSVVHRLSDLSAPLASVGNRGDPPPDGRGEEFHQATPTPDPHSPHPPKPRDMFVRDLHLDTIKVKGRDFR